MLARVNVRVLAIFGEQDRNVNWRNTVALYSRTEVGAVIRARTGVPDPPKLGPSSSPSTLVSCSCTVFSPSTRSRALSMDSLELLFSSSRSGDSGDEAMCSSDSLTGRNVSWSECLRGKHQELYQVTGRLPPRRIRTAAPLPSRFGNSFRLVASTSGQSPPASTCAHRVAGVRCEERRVSRIC
jgi:hypothetical protein